MKRYFRGTIIAVVATSMLFATTLLFGSQWSSTSTVAQGAFSASFKGWESASVRNERKAIVCVQFPDASDWGFDADLVIDGKNIRMLNWGLMNFRDPNTLNSSYRCYDIAFDESVVTEMARSKRPAQIRLYNIAVARPDVLQQFHCDAAAQRLRAKNLNIKIGCSADLNTGGMKVDLISGDPRLTEDQNQDQAIRALTDSTDTELVIDAPKEKFVADAK